MVIPLVKTSECKMYFLMPHLIMITMKKLMRAKMKDVKLIIDFQPQDGDNHAI